MTTWGFERSEDRSAGGIGKSFLSSIHRGLVFFLLGIFAVVRGIYDMRENPTVLIERVRGYSPELAGAVHVLEQRGSYASSSGNSVLPEKEPWEAFTLLMEKLRSSSVIVPYQYTDRYNFAQELSVFSKDMRSLLGFDRPQTYLIILQNTSEKRPNGGFFGSFAVLKISRGKIIEFNILDSYIPQYDRPNVSILGPVRLEGFLPDRDIHFVSANKVGFTYHDGAHIQELYEKTYPGQRVRGILFLRTDMFVRLLPGFQKQQRERQFVNAATDLIRKNQDFGKKELYLQGVGQYLRIHALTLAQAIISQGFDLIQEGMINVYLTSVSGPMHTFLRTHSLTTRFEEGRIYARDSNIAYNKIDDFVKKTITLRGSDQRVLRQGSSDVIPFSGALGAGKGTSYSGETAYSLEISYSLQVPETYMHLMEQLQKSYDVVLTSRERHILGIDPAWGTRGVVYFPPQARIRGVTGDISEYATFVTPFSRNAYYIANASGNNVSNTVRIDFTMNAGPGIYGP